MSHQDHIKPMIHWLKMGRQFAVEQQALVEQIYKDESVIYVEQEFKGGFGGARVLLVQPLNQQGERIARQIVKIGPKSELRREYDNAKNYVARTLPVVAARVENYTEGTEFAALAYTFMGDGILGETKTFEDYYQTTSPEQIKTMLKGILVESLGNIWYDQNKSYTCRFSDEYGRHLIEHLRIKIRKSSLDRIWKSNEPQEIFEEYQLLRGTDIEERHLNFSEGSLLRIDNLVITKVKPYELKLQVVNLPGVIIKVEGNLPETLSIGELVVVCGEVIYNRRERLETIVSRAFNRFPESTIDVKQEMIVWNDDQQPYPNPLHFYPEILSRLLRGRKSTVHGDLHLRNILVDAKDQGWLIDFALVTKRHNLYDFIKLETYIRQMILGQEQHDFTFADYLHFEKILTTASLGGDATPPVHSDLQKAYHVIFTIREIASHYMGHPPDFYGEYLPALFLYSLAALKYFDNHEARAAQLIFGTAVVLGAAITEDKPPGIPKPVLIKSNSHSEQTGVDEKPHRDDHKKEDRMPRPKRAIKISQIEDSEIQAAGENIVENATALPNINANQVADVDIEVTRVKRGEIAVAGQNIIKQEQDTIDPFDDLVDLLVDVLKQADEIDYLKEIVAELKNQNNLPQPEQNRFKVKQLLQNLKGFLEIAALTADQVGKAQKLFETLKGFMEFNHPIT